MIPDQLGERVEAFSHVGRVETEMDLRGGQVQHGGTGANAANKARRRDPSHEGTHTTCPDGHRTSTAVVGAGTTVTGTNVGIAGRAARSPSRRRSSFRQK